MEFVRCNPESQVQNSKIECNNSWIGIEGLTLSLWNKHVFKVIGSKCSGLMDIARCTVDLTCLTHAEVKLEGKEGGFLQEKLEIFCWGKRVQITFFLLNSHKTQLHGKQHSLG